MAVNIGAHERFELQELLAASRSHIRTMKLYRPHIQDLQLAEIADQQLQLAMEDYNRCVQAVQETSAQAPPKADDPRRPASLGPDDRITITDADAAVALMNLHKTSAAMKFMAALDCSQLQLRDTLLQDALHCAEQAFETSRNLNRNADRQMPAMKEGTPVNVSGEMNPMNLWRQNAIAFHGHSIRKRE
ncbi:spore coat protein [Paenibacillus sp. MWE-103]|uniref:Spore coat protein n=1 Tax=Paenibacillus artemisiicola TaxID=1172618 RepID=A0ABS3W5D3_9BACL|nr:spore coat protein [Paenibacillus artemisiicola]MBO7743396.1 spore coat protein [Paenibacillus artemisiicola]